MSLDFLTFFFFFFFAGLAVAFGLTEAGASAAAARVARFLRKSPRRLAGSSARSLASALAAGAELLARAPRPAAERRTVLARASVAERSRSSRPLASMRWASSSAPRLGGFPRRRRRVIAGVLRAGRRLGAGEDDGRDADGDPEY